MQQQDGSTGPDPVVVQNAAVEGDRLGGDPAVLDATWWAGVAETHQAENQPRQPEKTTREFFIRKARLRRGYSWPALSDQTTTGKTTARPRVEHRRLGLVAAGLRGYGSRRANSVAVTAGWGGRSLTRPMAQAASFLCRGRAVPTPRQPVGEAARASATGRSV